MSRLALLGGAPVRIVPFLPQQTIGDEEKAAVMAVLESGALSQFLGEPGPEFLGGPRVREMERAFADHFGSRYAVATNSATTALHAAVAACRLGPGDEVIVTPMTMTASATAILMQHAIPVFADVHPETFCLDPEAVRRAITPRTKAIMMVDLFGQPAHWDEIHGIAREHGLRVIEDAAQAAQAQHRGRFAGTLGDLGVLSLNYHKIIHCGEGGVILTSDPDLARRAQLVRNHGEVIMCEEPLDDLTNTFGSNYRMTEIEASIATAQLGKLPGLFAHRARLAAHLARRLQGLPGIVTPRLQPEVTSAFYAFAITLTDELGLDRRMFVEALAAEGIPVSEGYTRPIYLQPMYQQRMAYAKGCPWTCGGYDGHVSYAPGLCPVAERLQERDLITLTVCHPPQTEADMDDIAAAFNKVLAHASQLRERGTALSRSGT